MFLQISIRLCLVGCKIFSGKENIFGKGKYFQVFGCIPKNVLENIFWYLVVFLKIIEKIHILLDVHIFSTSKQNPTKKKSSMAWSEWKKTHSSEWWVWRMGSSKWWVRQRGAIWCDRRDVSGFVGNLVRVGSRMMARRSHRWCDNLSTLSSFSLCLSLCAWSENGETISMIGDWVRQGWVWTIGAMRSSCSDAIWLYSCSDKAIFLLFLSLSLLFSKAENRLKWKWKRKSFSTVLAIFYGQPGNGFQFDPIWSNNQTLTFPENQFWNQFEAKTNGALIAIVKRLVS